MCDDQPEPSHLGASLRRLLQTCSPLLARPAPAVRRLRSVDGRPLIMIAQRDDIVLVGPAEARKLARSLLRAARE